MKNLVMKDEAGNEIKLYSGFDALNALALIESLNMEFVADDAAEVN
jgi:hypothetical protein